MPTNIDLIFFEFALMFYAYGTYLHWGYESKYLSAHNPYINGAYEHYMHHALSIKNKPFYTGFFFKIWDQIFGTVYQGPCKCVRCEQDAGRRTREQFAKVAKPDYSVLLQPAFWSNGNANGTSTSKATEKATEKAKSSAVFAAQMRSRASPKRVPPPRRAEAYPVGKEE